MVEIRDKREERIINPYIELKEAYENAELMKRELDGEELYSDEKERKYNCCLFKEEIPNDFG
jgi:hypothetical protein